MRRIRPFENLGGVWEDERTRALNAALYEIRDAASLVSQGLLAPENVPAFRLPITPIDDKERALADDYYLAQEALRTAMERVELKKQEQVLKVLELQRLANADGGQAAAPIVEPATSPWVWVGVAGATVAVLGITWAVTRRKRR